MKTRSFHPPYFLARVFYEAGMYQKRGGMIKGFSLLEVLITLSILSVGVLGALSMQLYAMVNTQQAHLYSTAGQLANQMAEYIRYHRGVFSLEGGRSFLHVSTHEYGYKNTDCVEQTCVLPNHLPDFFAHWLNRVDHVLPEAKVVICRDRAPWQSAKQTLIWSCEGEASDGIVIKLGWREKNEIESYADEAVPPRIAWVVVPYQE